MDKILYSLGIIIKYITIQRVLIFGLFVLISLGGYLGYLYSPQISEYFIIGKKYEMNSLTPRAIASVEVFMKRYPEVIYLTVLKFDLPRNKRTPIYRYFNNDELRRLVYERLNGGDGALPVFIKGDESYNNQMIAIINGELVCDPFSAGGLARVWPDLIPQFRSSCRVPIPTSASAATRGYIVVHIVKDMTTYDLESMKQDLAKLANIIDENSR